jgi:hydrogenase maturation protein HypF
MDGKTYEIKIQGIVQGVGFRPFIHNLALSRRIRGRVFNTNEGVVVIATLSSKKELRGLIREILENRPPSAHIYKIRPKEIAACFFEDFRIISSESSKDGYALISPDIATCPHCIREMEDPLDRRFRYAFTNCTNCGPRFTIINSMPYDRPNTTMSDFNMCDDCQEEYDDSSDRRFHAQPNACPACGPTLSLFDSDHRPVKTKDPVLACAALIRDKKIIAIKGLGGFQIAASAMDDPTVKELRERKKRPFKPFAVMVKDIPMAKKLFIVSRKEEEALCSTRSPIVLLRKRRDYPLSVLVSGYMDSEGVMLAYTPIHHLLFKHIDFPLIMTSANISEEPIISENWQAFEKLSDICDYFLVHNRKISSRYDDSLLRIFNGRQMLLRRARGYAPYPVPLRTRGKKNVVFAAGPHEKNTFCFLREGNAIISQHIGDLEKYESIGLYRETVKHYMKMFKIKEIDTVVHDLHPDYYSTRFAQKMESPLKVGLSHHKAHILSVVAENSLKGSFLGFAWDGSGMGEDGQIWGSEVFLVDSQYRFKRIAHLLPYPLPGGSAAIKKPYRMGVSFLYKYYLNEGLCNKMDFAEFVFKKFPSFRTVVSSQEIGIIASQIKSSFNTPLTTSMGRLFDTVSSLLGLTQEASYEGEAAVHLQMIATKSHHERYPLLFEDLREKITIDSNDLISRIIYDLNKRLDAGTISAKFHNTIAYLICELAKTFRESNGIDKVVLSGGVFQNVLLLRHAFNLLKENGFRVFINFKVPVNDGGVSLGQAYYGFLISNGYLEK